MVIFSAIILFVLAGFHCVFAIKEIVGVAWVAANICGAFGRLLWV
jgi:hypothetical protein